jgi:hypothetical protein
VQLTEKWAYLGARLRLKGRSFKTLEKNDIKRAVRRLLKGRVIDRRVPYIVKRPPRNTKDFKVFSKCLKIAKKWRCG